jgi:hypothetical protein
MNDRLYYDMDFTQFPALEYKEENPDKGFAAIDVPQAFFGYAEGPAKDLRFMRTTVAQCVAVAFVGWEALKPVYGRKLRVTRHSHNKKKYPRVVLAHVDDAAPEAAQGLIAMCKKEGMVGLRAYVVNGDLEPPLLGEVVQSLRQARIPFELVFGCHLKTLAIDLVDGKPINPSVLEGSAEYKPNGYLENLYFQQVFGRMYSVGMAFDLTKGIPERYFRVGPDAPKEALAPVLEETNFKETAVSMSAKCETILVHGKAKKKERDNGEEKPTRRIRWAKERTYDISQIPTFTMETFTLGIPRKPTP